MIHRHKDKAGLRENMQEKNVLGTKHPWTQNIFGEKMSLDKTSLSDLKKTCTPRWENP
jgi:hypothetical protein